MASSSGHFTLDSCQGGAKIEELCRHGLLARTWLCRQEPNKGWIFGSMQHIMAKEIHVVDTLAGLKMQRTSGCI